MQKTGPNKHDTRLGTRRTQSYIADSYSQNSVSGKSGPDSQSKQPRPTSSGMAEHKSFNYEETLKGLSKYYLIGMPSKEMSFIFPFDHDNSL